MHFPSTLIALVLASFLLGARTSASDVAGPPDGMTAGPRAAKATADDPPCVPARTCRITRTRNVPTCPGIKIVDATPTSHPSTSYLTNPDAGPVRIRQQYWLTRGAGSPPVLLVEDSLLQDGSEPPGDSATEIVGCDLLFTYFERQRDSTCRIRDVRIHLDTLQPYREIESDGVLVRNRGYTSNPATRRAIRLPRGRGVAGSPLIAIDGPATLDKETSLPEVVAGSPVSATTNDDPPCVRAGTCRITHTGSVPTCTGMKIVDTMSTTGPTAPDGDPQCAGRSYWLVRGADASPVLLAEDCVTQMGAATTGTSTIEIKKCDVLFKYMEYTYDDGCFIREVGIHLDTLKVFRETEHDGVVRKNECKSRTTKGRAIRLPRGKGVADSPLIELDGRNLLDTGAARP